MMNISKVISDALRGAPPRPRERQKGGFDISPAEDFLEREVWPILKETRQALDAKGVDAIAVPPPPGDETRNYSLLILESCKKPEDACSARFFIRDKHVHILVRHPNRRDTEPVLLTPVGSVTMIQSVIEDFVFQCLAKKKEPEAPKSTRSRSLSPACNVPRLRSA